MIMLPMVYIQTHSYQIVGDFLFIVFIAFATVTHVLVATAAAVVVVIMSM